MEQINNGSSQGGEGKAAADDHNILAFHLLPWVPIAQWSPHSDDIAGDHLMQYCGHNSHLVHGEEQVSLLRWRGGDTNGNLALAGNGEFGKLASSMDKLLPVFRIQED